MNHGAAEETGIRLEVFNGFPMDVGTSRGSLHYGEKFHAGM